MLILDTAVKKVHSSTMPSPAPDARNSALYHAIGERVAARRSELELTQKQVAQRTNGRLTRSAVANIESGRQRVAVHHLFDLAQALGVAPTTLLPDPAEVPPPPVEAAERLKERVTRRREGRAPEWTSQTQEGT